jgi:parallel beta-helix repeat protein
MKAKRTKTKLVVSLLALGSTLTFLAFSMAGESDPGIPSGPDTQTNAQPIPSLPYTISQSGSYHLTQNLSHTNRNTNAIRVNADNVTIDLAGYSLIGPDFDSGTNNNGIYMNGRTNVEIRNGTVTGFGGNGIYEENNDEGSGHRVIAVRALSNGAHGIILWGSMHIVKDCTATFNSFAISSGHGALTCGSASTVIGNVAANNNIIGIKTGSGCIISDNTVSNNYYGISAWYGCNIIDNTSSYNGQVGIRAGGDGNLIKGNTLLANTQYGINVLGSYNAIEENLVTYSEVGINFSNSQNVSSNNRALNNTTNYGGSVPSGAGNGGGNIGLGTPVAGGAVGELQLDAKTYLLQSADAE